ncbi:TD and POZ domain-containing protein 1-like [Argiope bruennichi]|uniref:Speckle-type POZ protein B like protein n=1 Tax=Argiope bruennichi TaxID=94029 RepID=A0A8T0EDG6_ARGBR|nr:TD and POZ domain-containing protein 1-like [Argiope bruennichi]XP_055953857.1 TD and POZ domain-containing protein 1-like [Argiope bruennichi]KAF8770767.1 Speckle-type POZ protein B like protein [Argiope bruennichi]
MDHRRKFFKFIWKIKDFSFVFNRTFSFESPTFFVQELRGTKWNIVLYNEQSPLFESIVCRLQRQNYDFGPEHIQINYELSFISGDGTVICSQLFIHKTYTRGSSHHLSFIGVDKTKMIMHKKLSLPNDTLTIRCRIWKCVGVNSEAVRCTVESRIHTERISVTGTIENFCKLKTNSKNMVCMDSSSKEIVSSMNLCIDYDGKLDFQIKPVNCVVKTHKFRIFILDNFKNKLKVCQGEIFDTESLLIPLNLSIEYLMENKELYLPHDVLTIQCEFVFPEGNVLQIIHGNLYQYNSEDIQPVFTNVMNRDICEEHLTESMTTLKGGLLSLFNEGSLCDIELKVDTETFPAHKVILSAHSPVFKSMFTTDMIEKRDSSIEIKDLDADTVRQMLLFMYSENLDKLDYEKAKSLYFAADKYNIVSLKQKSSNFLKENLPFLNCCDILLLAEKHQDHDLKSYVEDFIAKNDEIILYSDAWKELENTHPWLTTEVLRAIYMKNRRT